jgi:cytochrome c553
MKKLSNLIGASILLAGISSPTLAVEDGATLFNTKGCAGCHGMGGMQPPVPGYPKVGQQSKTYVLTQLKDFKSGKRANAQAATMQGMLATVSDEEMESLATYLAKMPATDDTPTAEQHPLYMNKTCIACHGASGKTAAQDAYPRLVGQNESYLLTQMKDIKSGDRKNGHSIAMKNIMHIINDEEMATIAKWLSEQ